jgi:nitronate monooxygenase
MIEDNSLCKLLGIRYPIIQAGMGGGHTTPELVSAVSNAGGLGVLGAVRMAPDQLLTTIKKIKEKTTETSTTDTVIKYYITNPIIQQQITNQSSNALTPLDTI